MNIHKSKNGKEIYQYPSKRDLYSRLQLGKFNLFLVSLRHNQTIQILLRVHGQFLIINKQK